LCLTIKNILDFIYIHKFYNATLVEESKAGTYFEYVLVSLRYGGVFVLLGSVYNPGRLNFGEVEASLPVCLRVL
jgi:hypothetical protein